MSLLNSFTAEPQKTEAYSFKSGNIEDYLQELRTPREEMPVNENPAGELPVDSVQPADETQKPATAKEARATAELVTGIIEGAVKLSHDFIDKSEDNAFSSDESERVETAFENYFKITNVPDLPPGWMLVFTLAMVILPKTHAAFQRRKDKAENKRLQNENQRLQERLKALEKK